MFQMNTVHLFILDDGLTSMTISIYKNLIINMIPTPTKMHYLFDLRDISKVIVQH